MPFTARPRPDPSSDAFDRRLAEAATRVEETLATLLGEATLPGETLRPPRLLAAMRHAALGGGKRIRPFLVIETARLFGRAADAAVMRAAAALECVHCYSLVHDDLPAMDDDDLRRGRPTVHRAFDEATAILAGDALLTLAFDILADPATGPAGLRATLVLELARAAGPGGMAGGQMLDLAAEGRFGDPPRPAFDGIRQLQGMKTGALLRCACRSGALLGGAGESDLAALDAYSGAIGLAFQVADDLLDLVGDAAVTGKAVAKDAGRGKATIPALLGEIETRGLLGALILEADAALDRYGDAAAPLRAAARAIAWRDR